MGLIAAHFAALSDGLAGSESGPVDDHPASYNIAPTERIVVVRENDRRELRLMRWGLIPRWAGPQQGARPLVNARAETLREKPSFRDALAKGRCIVPASGFYEWKKVGKERLPYYITRRDGAPMAFAGLWVPWESPTGPVDTCAIVTVEANGMISSLHDRMPALLFGEDEGRWLDVRGVDAKEASMMLRPCADDLLWMHAVSPRMNRQMFDDPECIAPTEHIHVEELSLFGDEW